MLLVTALPLVVQLSLVASTPPQTSKVAPRFTVNLDNPPQQRWNDVVKVYNQEIQQLIKLARSMVQAEALELLEVLGPKVETVLPYPYNYEIIGIAGLLDGVSVGDVLLANVFYEATAYGDEAKNKACTSIVAEAQNGTIFHGRNLDYYMTGILRNMTITVDFQKGGKTVFTGTTIAGYIGLLTGQKPYGYTISLDERNRGKIWMNALEALAAGSAGIVSFHIRDTLSNEEFNFEHALIYLTDKPLIASCYIILGGTKPGEGAVITRDRTAAVDLWRIDAEKGAWYLVETNYDHWELPPNSDDRRDPAIEAMNNMTRADLSAMGLFEVLSVPPVLNNKTTYTAVMSAAQPELYNTWIRY